MPPNLDAIATQLALIAGFIGGILALLKGYHSARKEIRDTAPPEVAIIGSAVLDTKTVQDAVVKLHHMAADIRLMAADIRVMAALMTTQEQRLAADEKEASIRADERGKMERLREDGRRQRRDQP